MEKKRRVEIIIAIGILFLIIMGIWLSQIFTRSIISVIETNWNIELPDQMELVYTTDTTTNSWFGDGDRYTVFKLKEEPTEFIELYLKKTYKEFEDPIKMEAAFKVAVNANLIRLDIPAEYLPNWQKEYGWKDLESYNNTIFIMYFYDSHQLFILESYS